MTGEADIVKLKINVLFEDVSDTVTACMYAKVKRIEHEDDGSFTVVIDHWPTNVWHKEEKL